MDSHLDGLVDVTIVYPEGVPTFWDFLQGKCHRVILDARYLSLKPLDAESDDVRFKSKVARWINEAWKEKDARISHHLDAAVIE